MGALSRRPRRAFGDPSSPAMGVYPRVTSVKCVGHAHSADASASVRINSAGPFSIRARRRATSSLPRAMAPNVHLLFLRGETRHYGKRDDATMRRRVTGKPA